MAKVEQLIFIFRGHDHDMQNLGDDAYLEKELKIGVSLKRKGVVPFPYKNRNQYHKEEIQSAIATKDLKWTSQIVHGLLLRKADSKTVSQVNGIKFIVGNKVIQFTTQQFCVVTGLRFGNLPFIPIATNENCSLKRNEKHVHIDMQYLKLAEDLEEFVKYPWGVVSYAKTNVSLLMALCADYQ
ncbi:unnamed protein product [Prunus armeniaca]